MRQVSLGLFLFAFWLILSGHYTPFLLAIGLGSVALAVYVSSRMRVVDAEGHPIGLLSRWLGYLVWLYIEIMKSAWAVTRIIIDPKLPISPTMTKVRASQKTPAGIATYANSITLTPGTITTDVKGNVLTIHALVRGGADDLEGGDMDRHVSGFERGRV
ncbi:Cation antiporter [Candidatus Filomicrobium marinum]|uniref:Cation antiporter n=2 Tax=Filomicrobium TaxID=119044 RepID=A0A0D6JKI2_9HYPH|nr:MULTISPECIES: Na+/H+ antiporter subunit E [Filomicrobium]MCV0369123.1 Na+/H+ antiporter subunit E [Filomicrobium sp.]CFX61080.1 Cation antiporter [Candidatus Filomicrobium marinum]CPR22446.1 Cation antiporter [Candidatus Filomicrobium marinum]SDO84302.1 multisubunit sodium/proton antiporter, MrpE subunit (TC 2.A.63.1) [Filomicrobium insigne]